MYTLLKVFTEFVTILLLFYVLVFLSGILDLRSPTRERTHIPCIGRRSLTHWTAMEVLSQMDSNKSL